MEKKKDEIIKNMKRLAEKLKELFEEDVKITSMSIDGSKKWQFKIGSETGRLELDIWFYNIQETLDYLIMGQKNSEPVVRINWFEVNPQRIGLGTKTYNEFISILPDKVFRSVILDFNDESSREFWLSLGFNQIKGYARMYKDLY
ncbi:hypothetical protein [Priestia megaterium]|uniref:hypothetical protein n=1 Tax=Priestia megaterium TaxID=1404 RepID=UPI001C231E17|nr:hypothetical protein [Priestia megaterium]MBU8852765.1 hypothetical protein [Bacillus sp. FJAT-26377]MCU7738880.1 hypothetical protein [Priestia megaterium]